MRLSETGQRVWKTIEQVDKGVIEDIELWTGGIWYALVIGCRTTMEAEHDRGSNMEMMIEG